MTTSFNRVDIDLAALRHNFQCLKDRVGDQVRIMAVVKSDAYGHGMLPVAMALQKEGALTFGVAEAEEGVALRAHGICGDIVVLLGVLPDNFAEVLAGSLSPVVLDMEILTALSAASVAAKKVTGVHLKVDIGMGRLGVLPDQAAEMVAAINRLPGVKLAGILGHFPSADAVDPGMTLEQCGKFAGLVETLGLNGIFVHAANSAALSRFDASHFNMVRPGISLYGCQPGDDPRFFLPGLRPVMSFTTRVVQVKDVPAGFGISYGHTYVTERPTRLAVLPVGYADGYLRRLTNRSEVLIHGQKVPLRGRICMNACLADITDVEGVWPGDEVVLLGRQDGEEITAAQVAGWMETISYEILCLFGGSNSRRYINN